MSSYFPQFTQQTLIRSSTSSVDSNGQPFPGLRYTSHRSRYYASKGFEDDLEFCPEIEPSSVSVFLFVAVFIVNSNPELLSAIRI